MSDIALYRREDGNFDLCYDDGDLLMGKSLENSVLVSIGSDAREAGKKFKNVLQDDGWWGESTFEGDQWGSKLHELFKKRFDSNLILLANQYVEESLRWLVDDGVADSVSSNSSKDSKALYISITVSKGGQTENYRYEFLWSEVA